MIFKVLSDPNHKEWWPIERTHIGAGEKHEGRSRREELLCTDYAPSQIPPVPPGAGRGVWSKRTKLNRGAGRED